MNYTFYLQQISTNNTNLFYLSWIKEGHKRVNSVVEIAHESSRGLLGRMENKPEK